MGGTQLTCTPLWRSDMPRVHEDLTTVRQHGPVL